MGENAKRKSDGQTVKIGTYENLYYLRQYQLGTSLERHLRSRDRASDARRLRPGVPARRPGGARVIRRLILRWVGRRAQREAWASWNAARADRWVLRDGEEAF